MFIVSEKIEMLKILPQVDTGFAGHPNTDLYIDLHFTCVSIPPPPQEKKKENHTNK